MSRYLEIVRFKFQNSPLDVPTKPTKGAFVGFVGTESQVSGNSELGDNAHQPPVNVADELEQAIRQATNWADLEAVLEDAQRHYEVGKLDIETLERLATLAAREAQTMPEKADALRLSDLFDEAPIRRVYSKVLGEIVVFAADGADVPADLEGVVYRASELRQLVGSSPERLRAIHQAKRHLDGELIDDTEARIYDPAPS